MKKIVVVDYDYAWPAVFETLRARLAPVLGEAVTASVQGHGRTHEWTILRQDPTGPAVGARLM